jgi:hypothetical protein
MTGDQDIDYEQLAQDALRGIVRQVLTRVAKSGLPGPHHFYISFSTRAPGVSISSRLKERYPEEMTIVLQHRFWGLVVTEERFEVQLTFDSIPEHLVVPFSAVKVFFDPSVPYGLQFEGSDLAAASTQDLERDTEAPDTEPGKGEAPAQLPTPTRSDKKPRTRKPRAAKETLGGRPVSPLQPAEAGKNGPASRSEPPPQPAADNDTKIVHLDKFRKK